MKTAIAVMYGQGGKTIDMILGGDGTGKLFKSISEIPDVTAKLFESSDTNGVIAWLKKQPKEYAMMIGGTSLGANFSPYVGEQLAPRRIVYMFGIQPSMYGARFDYSSNVIYALCIVGNPLITGGFGSRKLVRKAGNTTTKVEYQSSWLPHPGDYGPAIHKPILADIYDLMK